MRYQSFDSLSICSEQLLGREYYQTAIGEPLFVVLPFTLHFAAASAKRALLGPPKSPSIFMTSGWSLASLLLPIHVMIHRRGPASPEAPILSLGPSQLDYEFVKVGLRLWPTISWTLYGALVGAMAIHAVEGTAIMFRYWKRRQSTASPGANSSKSTTESGAEAEPVATSPPKRRRRSPANARNRTVAVSVIISLVLGGLAILATEPLNLSRSLLSRIEASYMQESLFQATR